MKVKTFENLERERGQDGEYVLLANTALKKRSHQLILDSKGQQKGKSTFNGTT